MATPPRDMIKIYDAQAGVLVSKARIVKTPQEWKKTLTAVQHYVTTDKGTELPFTGEHNKNYRKGIYQCVRCGTDLFSSQHKFDSGTGWPSYYQPVHEANVGTEIDTSLFMKRVEVHCALCGAHLGHVFDDGPEPTGKRYCINSVSLKFKPDPQP